MFKETVLLKKYLNLIFLIHNHRIQADNLPDEVVKQDEVVKPDEVVKQDEIVKTDLIQSLQNSSTHDIAHRPTEI